MEKISPKMAAAFGVGFMGFILAAYSYNQQHKEEYIPTDDDNDVRNEWTSNDPKIQHVSFHQEIPEDLYWGAKELRIILDYWSASRTKAS